MASFKDHKKNKIEFESGVPKQQVASKSTKYKKPPQDNNSKFMEDFEPSLSVRELRKHQRKSYSEAKIPVTKVIGSMYDEKGVLRDNQIDLCDCLSTTCHGCHFPCPSCKSPKCGFVCRCNRKWMYEHIEFDGKDEIIKNPLYKSFNY